MCCSARIKASYSKNVRELVATINIETFLDVFWHWRGDNSIQILRALEVEFLHPQTEGERRVKAGAKWFASQQKARF